MKRLCLVLLVLPLLPLVAQANGQCVGRRGLAPVSTFSAPSYSYGCYGCYGGQPAQLPAYQPSFAPSCDTCQQPQQLPAYQPQYDMPSCAPQQQYQPQYDVGSSCAPQATPYAQAAFAPQYAVQRSFAPSYGYGYGVQRAFAPSYGVARAFAPAYGVGAAFAPGFGVGYATGAVVAPVFAPVVVRQRFFTPRFRGFGGGFGGSGALFIRGRNFSFGRF